MKKLLLSAGLGLVLSISGTAKAVTANWNFNTPNGAVGSPHNYMDTTNTFSLTAYGDTTADAVPGSATLGQTWGPGFGFVYNTGSVTSHQLYGKTDGVGETGLGLNGTSSDNEITNSSFVQLDLNSIMSAGATGMDISVGSIQIGEGFYLWGSNSLGTPGTLLDIGANPANGGVDQSITVPDFGTYRYITLSAQSHDVLLVTASATFGPAAGPSVPTPTAWASGVSLLGGLALLAMARKGYAKLKLA